MAVSRAGLLCALAAVLAGGAAWLLLRGSRGEPVFEGRGLRSWLQGHPRDYVRAVQAVGTNAVPFFLGELMVEDPAWKRWIEHGVARWIDANPPWETARLRHYHATLGLQALGSNAVPFLLDMALREPRAPGDTLRSRAVARVLASMETQDTVRAAVADALASEDEWRRLAACRAYAGGVQVRREDAHRLIRLSATGDAVERGEATRALLAQQRNEADVLPALTARLTDDEAWVRRVAIDALAVRGTNARSVVLPALLEAYTNEWRLPRGTGDPDGLYQGHAISVNEVRWALYWAIGQIDMASRPTWSVALPPALPAGQDAAR